MRTNKIEKKQRTVAALLSVQMKGTLNRLRYRSHPKHLYIYCRGKNIAKSFLANAESEGFTFGDGQPPTSKETTDIYALKDDFTISCTGWITVDSLDIKLVLRLIFILRIGENITKCLILFFCISVC